MFKFVIVLVVTVAAVSGAPGAVLAGYTAPVVAPAVVTAHSSQVISRNYNGLSVAAPLKAIATPFGAYYKAAPVAVATPLKAIATPFGAYYKAAPVTVDAPPHAAPVILGAPVKVAPVAVTARLLAAPVAVAAKPFAVPYKGASFAAVPVAAPLKFAAPYTFGAPVAAPLSSAPAYYF